MFKIVGGKVLLTIIAGAVFASYAFGSKTAGEYIDDSTLATKTKAALIEDQLAPAGDLNVEVDKGVLQLSGFVDTKDKKAAALAVANKIDGATKVLDAIVVIPGSRTVGETVDDTTLHAKVKAALAKTSVGDAVAITIDVYKGEVLLAGFVDKLSIADSAGDAAEGISGVKKVHNYIAVGY